MRILLFVTAALLALTAAPVTAQTLRVVGANERCAGETVSAIVMHTVVRDVITRDGRLGRAIAGGLEHLQPPTDSAVVRRYLLMRVGERCEEQARAESERILRAQPFISDAAIRAVPTGPGEVRLEVETIDEFELSAEFWGLKGLPAGLELATRNLGGRGEKLRALVEYGYGGQLGGLIGYTDHQALGRTLELEALASHRPLVEGVSLSLRRPFLTNYQRSSWVIGADYAQRYSTFRSPEIRDLTLFWARRQWQLGRVVRVGTPTSGANLGMALTGAEWWPVRTAVIRNEGPRDVPGPQLLARYPAFAALRAGVTVGVRRVKFTTVRGFDALSAPQDIAEGTQAFLLLLQGVSPSAGRAHDQVALFNFSAAAGSPRSMSQLAWQSETRFPYGDEDRRPQTVGGGRVAWRGQSSDAHTTTVGVEGSAGWHARLPLQLTFRGDDEGLIGWRTSEDGGSQRVIARFEDRWRVPLPTRRADFAMAVVAQSGKLWAGDAPYSVSSPWRGGVGIAFLGAVPAGSKQTIRVEIGRAVGPGAPRGGEIRISWSDRTRYFWQEPGDIWLARETSYLSQIY